MASIRRQGDAFEIRECIPTPSGPRQRALARFRRILTAADLDRAQAAARKPFDRTALARRARAQGIPVADSPSQAEARRLLAYLRDGGVVEPVLAKLLVESLSPFATRPDTMSDAPRDPTGASPVPLPERLETVLDWVGRGEAARGRALRGLLRTASRVVRSRGALREETGEPFPRFSSGRGFR